MNDLIHRIIYLEDKVKNLEQRLGDLEAKVAQLMLARDQENNIVKSKPFRLSPNTFPDPSPKFPFRN